jgi:membrane associated rhomboid family serine protease
MNPNTQYRLGPPLTPPPLKLLILLTVIVSIIAAIGEHWISFSLQQTLSLSLEGMQKGSFWQLITYLFVHPLNGGISFSFLLSLAFNAYLLWIIGTTLIEKKGLGSFFLFYFLSGVTAALAVFGLQALLHTPQPLAGNLTAIYALLIAWIIYHPQAQFFLFLTIPVKAKWLVLGMLGANLLIDLASGNWLYACAYAIAALFSYLYCQTIWRPRKIAAPTYQRAKIYDFKTGKAILNDEEFLEEMFSKISLKGKKSLTWRERYRLKRISLRKKKL